MSIEKVIRIVPVPERPVETDGMPWSQVEEKLGTILPCDYKDFISHYGSGRINNFIWILNPFSSNKNINLFEQITVQLDVLRTLAREFGESLPYRLFPENCGLLPVGLTDNGDVIHWLTCGGANSWKIIVNESRSPNYELHECGLAEFLIRMLTLHEQCNFFPKSILKNNATFESKC